MYTYAPPNENNTEGYLNTIISNLQVAFPDKNITRDTPVNEAIKDTLSTNIDFNNNTSFMDGDDNLFNTAFMQTSISASNAFFNNNPN
jgi:hypothetical protein